MASSFTARLRVEKQNTGENASTWGSKLNTNVFDLIDAAIAGISTIGDTGGAISLTANNGAADQARMMGLKFNGVLTSALTVTIPSVTKTYLVKNETSGAYSVTFTTGSGATVTVPQGTACFIFCDGTNVYRASIPVNLTSGLVDDAVVASDAGIDATKLGVGSVSNSELATLDGVSSPIQTQLNAKLEADDIGSIATYDVWFGTQAAYEALGEWDDNTIYHTTES